jgi:signal transduction histidine kinase
MLKKQQSLVIFFLLVVEVNLFAYNPAGDMRPVGMDDVLFQWNRTENQFKQSQSLYDGSYAASVKNFCSFLREYQKNYKHEMYLKYFMGTERKFKTLLDDANVLYTYALTMNNRDVNNARIRLSADIVDWENLEVAATNWTNEYFFKIIFLFSVLFLFFVASVLYYALQLQKSKRREEESISLNAKILQAQEAERTRLSRELHDTVAQDLKYTSLLAEKIPSRELSEQIRSNQSKCIEEIRAMCYNLSPPDFDTTDFPNALKQLCATFKKLANIEIRLSIPDETDFSFLDYNKSLNIYRLVQECLNNVYHHAQAQEVTVFLRNRKDKAGLSIFITDDGCGMDERLVNLLNEPSGKITTKDGSEHFGVRSMKERIHLLGGELIFNSMSGEGTEVIIYIPHEIKESE